MSVLEDQNGSMNQSFSEYPYGLYYTASEIYGYYPGDVGTPKVNAPEPAFTSRESECP